MGRTAIVLLTAVAGVAGAHAVQLIVAAILVAGLLTLWPSPRKARRS